MNRGASLLFGLGLVAMVFALLSLLVGIMTGAPTDLAWVGGNFLVGLVLLVVALIGSADTIRERLRTSESRRVGKYGGSAVASTLIFLAILGGLAFLSSLDDYHTRFDWSEANVHSLSGQSTKVLENLERDVEVVAFYGPMDKPQVEPLLERYEYASERFKVEYADPTVRPDLIEKYAVDPTKLAGGLLRVGFGEESVELSEVDEERLTNALVKLTRTTQKKVYFVEGHNERPVTGESAAEAFGFSQAADALKNENYRFETLLLEQTGAVPEDADVVIVAGPTRPFRDVEHQALTAYLTGGGALFVLIDPRAKTDLDTDLAAWGVDVGEDVIVDRLQGMFGRAATPFARVYGDHEITRDLREVTLFHVARSVRPRTDGGGAFTEIVKTGEDSWGERDLELFFQGGRAERGEDDLVGPVSLAVAGIPQVGGSNGEGDDPPSGENAEPRLVVFGDTDFATNEWIGAYRNKDLFVNSVNWLLGDVEAISVRPNQSRASRFELSSEQFTSIRNVSLFLLPEAIAALGVFTWWSRRRRSGR